MSRTLTVLHPGIESAPAPAVAKVEAKKAAHARARRLASLAGARIALLDNTKVNAREFLVAVAERLQRAHGAGEIRIFRKRHAGETGAAVIPDIAAWKPQLALTALGD